MPTYELWNDDNTKLEVSATTEDALKISKMVAKGYLLVVTPDPAPDHATEKLGAFIFASKERSWEVVERTAQEISDNSLFNKTILVSHTKQKAYNLIVAVIPEWKQRNYAARAVELQEIRFESGTLTLAESTELQNIRAVFVDQVKPIRSASDFIETEIASGKVTTTDQIDNHIEWEV